MITWLYFRREIDYREAVALVAVSPIAINDTRALVKLAAQGGPIEERRYAVDLLDALDAVRAERRERLRALAAKARWMAFAHRGRQRAEGGR